MICVPQTLLWPASLSQTIFPHRPPAHSLISTAPRPVWSIQTPVGPEAATLRSMMPGFAVIGAGGAGAAGLAGGAGPVSGVLVLPMPARRPKLDASTGCLGFSFFGFRFSRFPLCSRLAISNAPRTIQGIIGVLV